MVAILWMARKPVPTDPAMVMPGERAMLRSILGVLITIMVATAGEGAEVKILAALAVQDALGPIGASFSRDSGHTATIAYSTVGAIRKGSRRMSVPTLSS
jgi:hypothetical protein